MSEATAPFPGRHTRRSLVAAGALISAAAVAGIVVSLANEATQDGEG